LKLKKSSFIITISVLLLSLNSCKVNYSFTGASISPKIKTISVQYFPNYAPLVNATLSQTFTQALKDKFTSQTNLNFVDKSGDIQFEGQITDYSNQPTAIQGNQTAAQNRLTITVKVKYTNTFEDKLSFETSFTKFLDYPSNKSFPSVESDLVSQIVTQMVQDIFNKAVVNW
jgi:hypothetical protein